MSQSKLAQQMLAMWVASFVKPMIASAIKAAIPAEQIAGMLCGAAIGIAKKAGWSKEKFFELLEKEWSAPSPASDQSTPDTPGTSRST